MKKFILTSVGIVVLSYALIQWFAAFHQSGYEKGKSDGIEIGRTDLLSEQSESWDKEISAQWKAVNLLDGRTFFESKYSAPVLFDEPMNYIYSDKAVYAFPVGSFQLDEVYIMVMRKPTPEPRIIYVRRWESWKF